MSGVNRKSLMRIAKHRDPQGIGISRKITQNESQKIDYILPILDYLIEKREFYAVELKHHFNKINHKSIDGTISLLKKNQLIILDRTETKNKKIYKINSIKNIKQYRLDLQKYKAFKIVIGGALQSGTLKAIDDFGSLNDGFQKLLQKAQKKSQFVSPLPTDFFTKPLEIKNKATFSKLSATSKKWPESLSVNEMKSSIVPKIIDDYQRDRICPECFKNNKLRYFTLHDQEFLCDYGHLTRTDLNETSTYSENEILDMNKISKKFTDAQFEYQLKEYLNKEQKPDSNSQIPSFADFYEGI